MSGTTGNACTMARGCLRTVNPDHPVIAEFQRAAGFRRLAADLGESAASLADRYALSIPGVATVCTRSQDAKPRWLVNKNLATGDAPIKVNPATVQIFRLPAMAIRVSI
jgi:hypothetical protein